MTCGGKISTFFQVLEDQSPVGRSPLTRLDASFSRGMTYPGGKYVLGLGPRTNEDAIRTSVRKSREFWFVTNPDISGAYMSTMYLKIPL